MYNLIEHKTLVESTLKEVGLYKEDAVWLLLGTRAQESAFGKYSRQIGGGPALGTYQMEPATFNDIVNTYLRYRKPLRKKIMKVCDVNYFDPQDLLSNEKLAICFARLKYYRVKEALPSKNDISAMAHYWKQYYNSYKGAGKPSEFISNWYHFMLHDLLMNEALK